MSNATERPGEARPWERHWIVMCLSKKQDQPTELPTKLRHYFRHPSEESAEREAARLSRMRPGRRFAVYASGRTWKVETGHAADREYDSWFAVNTEART